LSGLVTSTITRNLVWTKNLEPVTGGLTGCLGPRRRRWQPLPDRGQTTTLTTRHVGGDRAVDRLSHCWLHGRSTSRSSSGITLPRQHWPQPVQSQYSTIRRVLIGKVGLLMIDELVISTSRK